MSIKKLFKIALLTMIFFSLGNIVVNYFYSQQNDNMKRKLYYSEGYIKHVDIELVREIMSKKYFDAKLFREIAKQEHNMYEVKKMNFEQRERHFKSIWSDIDLQEGGIELRLALIDRYKEMPVAKKCIIFMYVLGPYVTKNLAWDTSLQNRAEKKFKKIQSKEDLITKCGKVGVQPFYMVLLEYDSKFNVLSKEEQEITWRIRISDLKILIEKTEEVLSEVEDESKVKLIKKSINNYRNELEKLYAKINK